jgi:hypothetical protein
MLQIYENKNENFTLTLVDFEGVVLYIASFWMQRYSTQKSWLPLDTLSEVLCNILSDT